MEKYTIVPEAFFVEGDGRKILSELVEIDAADTVKHMELPQFEAVLVYCNVLPAIASLLDRFSSISSYNKVMFNIAGGALNLVIGEGDSLMLANSYEVPDFTTALYFIFAAMKDFQINPEMTDIYFDIDLAYEQQELLFKYFRGAEKL